MAGPRIRFTTLDTGRPHLRAAALVLGVVILAALGAAFLMEHHGHAITGMNNTVVWGLPHVFAIFLIVAASGALNVASMASVFGRTVYKPLAPLSGLLAMALLAGGLFVLVLDLGRPDRLTVALTHVNPTSIFAWNVILYSGFFALVAAYLWALLDRRVGRHAGTIGLAAFIWRLVLTTGTGSIFGFLAARDVYHSAVMAPLFIAMSLSFGLAVFLLVLFALHGRDGMGDALIGRLGRLQALFVAVVLYFVVVQHLTGLYTARGAEVERFLLGGPWAPAFWLGQILIGTLAPLVLLLVPPFSRAPQYVPIAAALVAVGGWFQVYALVIGGQSLPLTLLPGLDVTSEVPAAYAPSLPEALLGLGGVAVALALVVAGCAVLRVLPRGLVDETASGEG
ncbi:MAG TPA: NrfD/PsrC family molybdoenzyme membrane anchor subunit [Azospirillum sp.]|nr:NrfD/PsrC family molybdoenzyme membrane anchor subunit [Azospirillum sp.]